MCHRILRVRLRFQQSNMQQKDSVYIEFAEVASADAAVASPPLQPGASSKRLRCLHKQDYEKQQRGFAQTSSLGTSTGKRKQGSADSTGDNAGDFSVNLEQPRKRSKSTSDKAKQVDELQVALQKEQAESARLREVAKLVSMPSYFENGASACSMHHLVSVLACTAVFSSIVNTSTAVAHTHMQNNASGICQSAGSTERG